jgi:chorismate synthase
MSSSTGTFLVFTCFGESHGNCIGAVVDGCPAGLPLTVNDIQTEINRRKPQGASGTGRREPDQVELVSGVFNNHTTGAPICMMVRNRDVDSSVYENIRFVPRPGHADYPAYVKYGGFNDYRGGGRFSGRITAAFVMAGAVATKLLNILDIDIIAHTVQIGDIKADVFNFNEIKRNSARNELMCADKDAVIKMKRLIKQVSGDGDSIGGAVEIIARGLPVGLGEPVFDTMEGDLARAYFSIPAVKGVEFGSGFNIAEKRGSENNDLYMVKGKKIATRTNFAGGILGGLSTGMPLIARIAVKPTASISREQKSVDMRTMKEKGLVIKGRHDTCIVPRAVPVVESMTALVLADYALRAGLISRVI